MNMIRQEIMLVVCSSSLPILTGRYHTTLNRIRNIGAIALSYPPPPHPPCYCDCYWWLIMKNAAESWHLEIQPWKFHKIWNCVLDSRHSKFKIQARPLCVDWKFHLKFCWPPRKLYFVFNPWIGWNYAISLLISPLKKFCAGWTE